MLNRADFFQNIHDRGESLSPLKRKIVRYLLENYQKAAFLTAREIGERNGVSESTVNRLSRDLGYSGYPEFIRNLKDIVHAELTADKRLELMDTREYQSGLVYLNRIISDEINNLRELSRLDTGAFEDFVQAVIQAERVVVVGSRFSAIAARHFHYGLFKIRDNVDCIEHIDSLAYDRLEFFDDTTLIVAFGLGRYSREIYEFLEAAHCRNIKIITITDSPISPFIRQSSVALIAPIEIESFAGTVSAPGCLVLALLSEISVRTREASMTRLKRLEKIAKKQCYYI